MNEPRRIFRAISRALLLAFVVDRVAVTQTKSSGSVAIIPPQGLKMATPGPNKLISEADCTLDKLGDNIPVGSIGEPVAAVTLKLPTWNLAANGNPAYCSIDGSMAPVDKAATARPILFRVIMPESWAYRAAQIGGGGMNGVIPDLLANPGAHESESLLPRGFALYGSDSGHQSNFRPPSGGPGTPQAGGIQPQTPPAPGSNDWALNDEAIRNLGYAQLKKTHDAAMVLLSRMYGARPRFNYFFGTSQGGREALTVVQRYPADYDGVAANVPIVNFSSLMLAPELIRIQEKPRANWVTMAKVNAIRGEVVRQCDKLDGLVDGIVNNYMACRAIFDARQGAPNRHPWASKRCPNNIDPDPADTSPAACLTDGQIATLEMVYSRYIFATPLANGVKSFGMWLPNTDPSGSGLIVPSRFRGQEGAPPDARTHSHLGILGVTGFLMQDLSANPLDYVEGGPLDTRRKYLSELLDSTNPDLDPFYRRGGKLLVVIGTNDTLASPGAQLDYYQSVLDKLGRNKVDAFARFYVLPQTSHALSGTIYGTDSDGNAVTPAAIPNTYDRVGLLIDWVEKIRAPDKQVPVTARSRSLPMCSYPSYPKYHGGPKENAASYTCAIN
jgi:feruloyl esterase